MLETSITLNDKDGTAVALQDDTDRLITSIEGLSGIPGVREVSRPKPNAHGSIDESKYMDGRVITIAFEVTGATDTLCWAEWDAMLKPMVQTLDNGPALLKWQRADTSTSLQCSVKLIDMEQPVFEELQGLLRSQVSLRAVDPRSYSQTLTDEQGTALASGGGGKTYNFTYPRTYTQSSGGEVTFVNTGTVPAPVVFTIHGKARAGFAVVLEETGERIQFSADAELAEGDTLTIDTNARTILLNNQTNKLALLDYELTDSWLLAPVGTSTFRLIATDFSAATRLDVQGRPAYL